MARVSTGLPTTLPAMRPQTPPLCRPTLGIRGQNTLRPSTASSAGSRVRLAARATAIPMARAGPSPLYNPNVATTTVARAPMTVRPEKVIDSPTLHSENDTASPTLFPRRSSSRSRKMRNSP